MYNATAGQVITCNAAVAWAAGEPLKIEQVQVAPPQEMEVRIKICYTSLCRSDLIFWQAKGQTPMFPRIFGHEAAGKCGRGSNRYEGGRPYTACIYTGECGECRHCKSEESNVCYFLRANSDRGVMISDGKSRFSIGGQPIYHFMGTSTFSEYIVVHVGCVAKIHPAAPLDKVCILSCGVSTGMGCGILVGVPHSDAAFSTNPMNILSERTLKGTFFGNYKPKSDLPRLVEKFTNKELELEKFITREISFDEINKTFDYMIKGEGLRYVIKLET